MFDDFEEILQIGNDSIPVDTIYTVVEQMPSFPGGEAEMMKYVSKNLKYPTIAKESGVQGRFTARFVVNGEGN